MTAETEWGTGTLNNVSVLKSRGAVVADVEKGELACGYEGEGRMASLDVIMAALEKAAGRAQAAPSRRSGRRRKAGGN